MPINFLGESIRNWKRDSKQTDCHWTGQEFMNSEYCSVRIIFKMIHQLDWCNAIQCSLPCLSLCRMNRNYREMVPYHLDRDVFSLPRRCSKNSALFNLSAARCEIICSISQSPWLSGQARTQNSGCYANTPNPKGSKIRKIYASSIWGIEPFQFAKGHFTLVPASNHPKSLGLDYALHNGTQNRAL